MDNMLDNQMMYLASWEFLRRIARENRLDRTVINNLNRINAESLMCDLLPIPEIAEMTKPRKSAKL